MKKIMFTILLYGIISIVLSGCILNKRKETISEEQERYSKTIDDTTIEFNIPDEWEFEELEESENYKFALKISTKQDNHYFMLYYYNTGFSVCGTGRREERLDLNQGNFAKVGYYDGSETWSDISFYDINSYIAFVNYNTDDDEVFSFIKTMNIKKVGYLDRHEGK